MLNAPPILVAVDIIPNSKLVLSITWSQWFNALYNFVLAKVDYTSASIQVLATGFSITIDNRGQVVTINPAGVLATGTITMPKTPYDGQPIEVSTTQTITGLTVSANAGQTIKNAPTTLVAGSGFAYYYNAAALTWFRRY